MARYDERTALIVTDVQNDFADPKGSLYVHGGEEVVQAVNTEIAAALQGGASIVYTQDWHPPDTPHFEKDGGVWPVHCVVGTWGSELHPALEQVHDADVVRKGTAGDDGYSAFGERDPETGEVRATGLDDVLQAHGIRRVVVVGLATDYCVKETVLDARRRGLPTEVPAESVAAVDVEAGDGARALEEMRAAGAAVV
ncbi:MAG: nicotinamidase/pyrazinamidase [Actinomycetota bacterium]|nr:nicotinamidase/pyrazinamidase [Actinomycetota bacterium]